MTFLDRLREGEFGLTFDAPTSFVLEEEHGIWVRLRSDVRRVHWNFGLMPAVVDLDPKHSELLRNDLERDARATFESNFAARNTQPGSPRMLPRTSDPTWSPVVSMEQTSIDGAPALVVIQRLTYEPGNELVAGHLMIPVEGMTVHFSALSGTNSTGQRERELVIARWQAEAAHAPAVQGNRPGQPTQSEIDDPILDAQWPEHPLCLVRNALAWLRGTDAQIRVTRPSIAISGVRVELPEAGCAITPPPRFHFAPMYAAQMSPTLATFTRTSLPGGPIYAIDIWHLSDVKLRGIGVGWRLRRLAAKTLRGWAREGAEGIEIQVTSLPALGSRTRALSFVRFVTAEGPAQAIAIWIADLDGSVFRIAASGGLELDRKELEGWVRRVANSWSRLP